MYKSPIEVATIINTQVEQAVQSSYKEVENRVYSAILQAGVNVDKDELIKALQYDREQYAKGYADGIRALAKRLKEMCDAPNWCVWLSEVDNAEREMVGADNGL